MIGMNSKTHIYRLMAKAACLLLAVFMMAGGLAAVPSYAEDKDKGKTEEEKPVREVHKVAIGDRQYCFFATHYVVLTPEEVAGMSDEELNAEIIKRSGLYMKEENCHKASHKAIKPEAWKKKGGMIFVSPEDIAGIRAAEPADGAPVKISMDVNITTEPITPYQNRSSDGMTDKVGDGGQTDGEQADSKQTDEKTEEKTKIYSTFKRTSPRILFAAIATPADAAYGEDICKEDKPAPEKAPDPGKAVIPPDGGGDEMLPEFRTANMTDRSGKPVEETLKDGDPVKLEWIEPGKKGNEDGKGSFFSKPAVWIGSGLLAAAIIAAVIIAMKRREED